jgi:hypothetical protein
MPLTAFVGYDVREDEAYKVCRWSMVRRCSEPIHVFPLAQKALRQIGLFSRPATMDASGQWFDGLDQKPFSTEFSFTRFLVPELARRAGIKDWVLFVDSDFLYLGDVARLYRQCRADHSDKALVVVPQDYQKEGTKMDGVAQQSYNRKLWSAMMMFNMSHPSNSELGVSEVNTWHGNKLHALGWLLDHEIGFARPDWHCINSAPESWGGYFPSAIHYTEGGPWFENYRNCPMAEEWLAEQAHMKAAMEVDRLPAMRIGI